MQHDTATSPTVEVPAEPMSMGDYIVKEAIKWVGVREKGGSNKGPEVEMFQKAVDGRASGEPWCMAFVQFVVKQVAKAHGLMDHLYDTEHCLTAFNGSPVSSRIPLSQVKPGDIVIWRHGSSTSGHTGFIEAVNRDTYGEIVSLRTIEGNTSDASMREGDGVYRRLRSPFNEGTMRVVGFLRVL